FESESGAIGRPGPAIFAQLVSSGNTETDLSGIPTGPTGTVSRHILATRTIPNFNGNQMAYSFYAIPNGRIDNNIDTTFSVNFYESELIVPMDFLFQQLEFIPASLGLAVHNAKLVTWNEDGF